MTSIGDAILGEADVERAYVVLLTSARRVAGLPDVALRLARHMSAAARRVIVVDTAFGEGMAKAIGAEGKRGLGDLLAGTAAFETALFRDPKSRVHVIPAGQRPADPLILASSERMETVLEALDQTYQVIILLAPAINRRAEARFLARRADFAVLVTRKSSSDTAADCARERLHDAGIEDVALVMLDDDGASGEPDFMLNTAGSVPRLTEDAA